MKSECLLTNDLVTFPYQQNTKTHKTFIITSTLSRYNHKKEKLLKN